MADMYIQRGQTVFGSRGLVLGRVRQIDESGFVVEKGLVFAEDYPVRYEDIESVREDGIHLRIVGSALVPEEEAEPWEPARDPVGTAGGTDIEPLRAGMAEIDEHQQHERAAAPEGRAAPALGPRRGERRRRATLAREARAGGRDRAARPSGARESPGHGASGPIDADVEEHIEEEIEDFEREASCSASRDIEDPLLQAQRTAQRTEKREGERGGAEPPSRGGASPGERPSGRPARERHYRFGRIDYRTAAPEALKTMARLESYVRNCGLERSLLELVKLRASQMNGCGYCIDMHTKDARREGETEQRLYTLQVWDETRFFTDRERAALAWTEAVTRLGPDHLRDEVFQQAREQFSETELVNLTMAIITINGWNRLAIAFRTEPGSYQPPGAYPSPTK